MGYYKPVTVISSTSGKTGPQGPQGIPGLPTIIDSDTTPTTRVDGTALVIGDTWWNSSTSTLYYWLPDENGVYSWLQNPTVQDTRRASTSRISSSQQSIWVGETGPVIDPTGVPGWHFASDNSKITWDLWQQDANAEYQFTYQDLKSASLVLRNAGSRYPYFSIYTRRKNDGNDANIGYRSRYTFETTQDDSGIPSVRMMTTRADNPLYSNLPHTTLTFNPTSSVGPQEPDEIVKNITLSSNSGAISGQFTFTAQELILDTTNEVFHVQIDYDPVIDPNTARMYYQDSSPGILGRQDGDLWYNTSNSSLSIWTGSWTLLST